eukprot:g44296.t1
MISKLSFPAFACIQRQGLLAAFFTGGGRVFCLNSQGGQMFCLNTQEKASFRKFTGQGILSSVRVRLLAQSSIKGV